MTTTVRERPILFSAPMVRAILDEQKTQTRRLVKPQPIGNWYWNNFVVVDESDKKHAVPYRNGDRLWVRETWRELGSGQRADGKIPKIKVPCIYAADNPDDGPFRPSIHMPRWASRLALEITSVRVQRLQEISDEDAIAEGCQCAGVPASLTDRGAFSRLWDSINGKTHPWASNPWVWVIEFRRIEE